MIDEKVKKRTHQVTPMESHAQTDRPGKSAGKSAQAVRALSNAAAERRSAQNTDRMAPLHLAEAERLEKVAAALMTPSGMPTVESGEVAFISADAGLPSEIVDTLANPNQAAIEASVARTDLLLMPDTNLVALGIDAAASVNASNSLEKMLAHQIAALHALTMKTVGRALEFEKRLDVNDDGMRQLDSVEFSRTAQAAARLSSTFQAALLTMQRLRNGLSQTMTIHHVTVGPGGQAVIGNVKGGGLPADEAGKGKTK